MNKKLTYLIILSLVLTLVLLVSPSSLSKKEKTIISGNLSTIMINKTIKQNYKWEYNIEDNNIVEIVSKVHTKQLKTDHENVINDIHLWYLKALSTGCTMLGFNIVDSSGQKVSQESIKYKVRVLPETIEVRRGNLVKIELKENRSTGFTWHLDMEDNNLTKVHHDDYIEPETIPGKVGQSGIHYWYIKGVNKGETILSFKYYRDWDKKQVANTIQYKIKIK